MDSGIQIGNGIWSSQNMVFVQNVKKLHPYIFLELIFWYEVMFLFSAMIFGIYTGIQKAEKESNRKNGMLWNTCLFCWNTCFYVFATTTAAAVDKILAPILSGNNWRFRWRWYEQKWGLVPHNVLANYLITLFQLKVEMFGLQPQNITNIIKSTIFFLFMKLMSFFIINNIENLCTQ